MTSFLFIASDYKPKPGGIATYLDNLARGLIALGNEVRVLALVPSNERDRITFLEHYEQWALPFPVALDERPKNWLGYKCISFLEILRCLLPRSRRVWEQCPFFRPSAHYVSQLKAILEKEVPQTIVFGHLDLKFYPLFIFLLEQKIPYGIIAHDFEVYLDKGKPNDWVMKRVILNGAKWLVANSQHTQSLLRMWNIPAEKIMIVNPPISEQAIEQSADFHPRDRNADFNLITICRLIENKGVDIVLRALKILDERRIPWQYVIAGDGAERKNLEQLVNEFGMADRVRFVGSITEETKWSLLRNADVYVMPSRVHPEVQHEGFGISFIEAAAFGVPGVGSTGGGIPDAVIHGETGLLVPEESPEKVAEALQILYDNPQIRRQMGRVAMGRARGLFSPTAIAAHFQAELSKGISEDTETAQDHEAPHGDESVQGSAPAIFGRPSAR